MGLAHSPRVYGTWAIGEDNNTLHLSSLKMPLPVPATTTMGKMHLRERGWEQSQVPL